MIDKDQYPAIHKLLVESAVPMPRSGGLFATLEKYKVVGGKQVFRRGKGKRTRFYVWDGSHTEGHWEVYNRSRVNILSQKNDGIVLGEFTSSDNRKRLGK
jgi:hypothetical protein